MTPTMSEYFEAWKNSRFIAGDKATEKAFVAASRLQDIARHPRRPRARLRQRRAARSRRRTPQQAQQTGDDLTKLHALRRRGCATEEAGGKKFTAEDADTLGTEAQERAEAIAGQISQAAGKLGHRAQES